MLGAERFEKLGQLDLDVGVARRGSPRTVRPVLPGYESLEPRGVVHGGEDDGRCVGGFEGVDIGTTAGTIIAALDAEQAARGRE
jgi:hypothetical protein